ncbi:transmembrane protein 144-like [Haliotis rubra]|uniref:transmembrane protein 144-like n=1 Tax=Haliotis rubra TaxID=36100 RepID=UPI001EE5DBF2|nr:transmembrane protein 144-like [Haliotis rubra]
MENTTTPLSNGTDVDGLPQYVGFICCAIASIMYGTNYVPVKKFETGDGGRMMASGDDRTVDGGRRADDGMFFQWVLGNGILIVGMVIQTIRLSRFYPFAMVGGSLWATVLAPGTLGSRQPSLKCILKAPDANRTASPAARTCRAVRNEIAARRLPMPVMRRSARQRRRPAALLEPAKVPRKCTGASDAKVRKVEDNRAARPNPAQVAARQRKESIWRWRYGGKRSTVMYAFVKPDIQPITMELTRPDDVAADSKFIPARYLQEQEKDNGASQNCEDVAPIDYVFAHFCGIYLTATVYFVIYALFRRNRPKVFLRVMVPGLVAGLMWGVGTASWFISNMVLSDPVSFPIVSTFPMGISLLIGVLAFKEIKGRRNIIIVVVAMTFTIAGSVVAGVSKT